MFIKKKLFALFCWGLFGGAREVSLFLFFCADCEYILQGIINNGAVSFCDCLKH